MRIHYKLILLLLTSHSLHAMDPIKPAELKNSSKPAKKIQVESSFSKIGGAIRYIVWKTLKLYILYEVMNYNWKLGWRQGLRQRRLNYDIAFNLGRIQGALDAQRPLRYFTGEFYTLDGNSDIAPSL